MLVISRNKNERLVIGDATITVVRGSNVSLGVDAPKDMRVIRMDACSETTDISVVEMVPVAESVSPSRVLSNLKRIAMLRDELAEAIRSTFTNNEGFEEGCPLATLAYQLKEAESVCERLVRDEEYDELNSVSEDSE